MKIELLEMAGLGSALKALRLSYGKEMRSGVVSDVYSREPGDFKYETSVAMNPDDLALMQKLIAAGDEHAKVLRGVLVYVAITAPRYWWQEMVTYDKIGSQCLMSESTMHIQGKGLSTEDLVRMKENLTEGTEQKRIYYFSYQTLRRIYRQRRNHRLPVWHTFCEWVESLPFANELITNGL